MSANVLRALQVRARFDRVVREQLRFQPLRFLQDYDLTPEEQLQLILPNFSWLEAGRIAALGLPESADAFQLLYRLGVRLVINLTESPHPAEYLTTAGLQCEHIPIPDLAPPTPEQVQQAMEIIHRSLSEQQPVAVHCLAGVGRTGTILACYLVSTGIAAEAAIRAVREARPGSIESPAQMASVYAYARSLQ